jgi:hypothetical protein
VGRRGFAGFIICRATLTDAHLGSGCGGNQRKQRRQAHEPLRNDSSRFSTSRQPHKAADSRRNHKSQPTRHQVLCHRSHVASRVNTQCACHRAGTSAAPDVTARRDLIGREEEPPAAPPPWSSGRCCGLSGEPLPRRLVDNLLPAAVYRSELRRRRARDHRDRRHLQRRSRAEQ